MILHTVFQALTHRTSSIYDMVNPENKQVGLILEDLGGIPLVTIYTM